MSLSFVKRTVCNVVGTIQGKVEPGKNYKESLFINDIEAPRDFQDSGCLGNTVLSVLSLDMVRARGKLGYRTQMTQSRFYKTTFIHAELILWVRVLFSSEPYNKIFYHVNGALNAY